MTALNPDAPKQPEQQAQAQVEASTPQLDTNVTQQKQEKPIENHEDPDWRAFREARKKDREERRAAETRAAEKEQEVAALKAAMEATFSSKSAPSPQAYQQYYGTNDQEETEEQKIERKVNEMLTKKEEQYRKEQYEYEQKEYPNRLKKDFPDIWHVCSQENLDYLDYHYPELSRPLQRLQEGYDKWSDIYHAIKKFIPNHSTAKKEAAKADINSLKPRSIASTGPSPTGEKPRESWQEIESRRAENWARMERIRKGI